MLYQLTNRSVHGLGKWYENVKTVNWSLRNSGYHLLKSFPFYRKKERQSLKMVSKMDFNKSDTSFIWGLYADVFLITSKSAAYNWGFISENLISGNLHY